MPKYFISHAFEDRDFVENELISVLDNLGINYSYSEEDVKGGQIWELWIKNALESCDGLILVMSPDSSTSDWVKYELSWSIEKRFGRIIPILYRDCKSSDFHIHLRQIQHIDYRTDRNEGHDKLVSILTDVEITANSRILAIEGRWSGILKELSNTNELKDSFPVEVELKVISYKEVKGSLTIVHPRAGEVYFKVTGGFLYGRFILFSYHTIDAGAVRFGSAITELDETGEKMDGKWISYGALAHAIISGEVTVNCKEHQAAKKAIRFLEDKRIFDMAFNLEHPKGCYESAEEIRRKLTEIMNGVPGTEGCHHLSNLRQVCSNFMRRMEENKLQIVTYASQLTPAQKDLFYKLLQQFRHNSKKPISSVAKVYGVETKDYLSNFLNDT